MQNQIEILSEKRTAKKTVARVLAGDGKAGDAIVLLERAKRKAWAYADWVAKLRELEADQRTVADYLKENGHGQGA